jgi:hypothetical protein
MVHRTSFEYDWVMQHDKNDLDHISYMHHNREIDLECPHQSYSVLGDSYISNQHSNKTLAHIVVGLNVCLHLYRLED